MRGRKKYLALTAVLCAALCLSSCINAGIPVSDGKAYALPEVQTAFVAPIGDAMLEYTQPAVFYLPRHDGARLISVTDTIPLSEGRLTAESIVRLLLEQPGSSIASPLGGDVKLSLYGANPVEVSGDVATVNLAASALQLDRKTLCLVSHAITNTLTEMENIQYVNTLVADKAIPLDLASTLPAGALTRSMGEDIDALYEQQLSRRVTSGENAGEKRLTATATLYFPLAHINGVMAEARNITFDSMKPDDMAVTLMREISVGAAVVRGSPAMSLLTEYLLDTPQISQPSSIGGNLITLEFSYLLDEMLRAAGIPRASCMAALCYTLTTFLPNVAGIEVYIDSELVEHVMLGSTSGILFDNGIQRRADFAALLMDNATLYFADSARQKLITVSRPIAFYRTSNPRALLTELFRGPSAEDSVKDAQALLPAGAMKDPDIIGISLDGDTLLVNFSNSFLAAGQGLSADEDRLLAYSLTNTLLHAANARRVAFFVGGSQTDGFTEEISWKGWFLENLGVVID
ncbi:MAG: GerMN domain-containing protein [Clostridiales bacterium]|nr:GerMN domain-containing protein [Clostridiales bacterium]